MSLVVADADADAADAAAASAVLTEGVVVCGFLGSSCQILSPDGGMLSDGGGRCRSSML